MPAIKTLVGKLLLVPLAIENWLVLAIGLAGVLTWISGELVEIESSDPWGALLSSCLIFFRRMTVTFLILGGLAWFLNRVRRRALSAPIRAEVETPQAWFFLVSVILGVQGALAGIFAQPLISLIPENIQLLQSWGVWEGLRHGRELSGIFLIPVLGILLAPGLGAMTGFAFIWGAAVSLGYLFLRLEESWPVLLRSICLQIAFLLGLFFTQDLFDAGGRIVAEGFTGPDALELKAKVLPWLNGQKAVFSPMARRFAWLLPGFFICAAVILQKAWEKGWRDEEKEMPFMGKAPAEESAQVELSRNFVETDERFNHRNYLIKYKFFSNPLYKVFDIFDSDNKLVFVARMNALSLLTRVITVYGAGKEDGETLSIIGRRLVRFPNIFDMVDCPTNKKVGSFKQSHTGWMIMDEYGRQIAAMKVEEGTWGSTKGQIWIGRMPVCTYIFQNMIRPIIMIDLFDDSGAAFDKKLGIGLALVLGFQSVAFNDPTSDSTPSSSI